MNTRTVEFGNEGSDRIDRREKSFSYFVYCLWWLVMPRETKRRNITTSLLKHK